MEKIWVGSPTDVRYGKDAEKALAVTNDSKFVVAGTTEVVKVSDERWKQAQDFERKTWMEICPHAQSDRNHEHAAAFNDYKSLPKQLGDVIEVGCGPFTQFVTIANGRDYTSLTLLDPLLNTYLTHPNCSYKTLEARKLSIRLEDLEDVKRFDTAICINVFEHVIDADTAFFKLMRSIKPGGILVFNERSWSVSPTELYDVGHPIRIGERSIEWVTSKCDILYHKRMDSPESINHYLIMKKR